MPHAVCLTLVLVAVACGAYAPSGGATGAALCPTGATLAAAEVAAVRALAEDIGPGRLAAQHASCTVDTSQGPIALFTTDSSTVRSCWLRAPDGSMQCEGPPSPKPGVSYDFSDDLEPRPLDGHSGPQARVVVGDRRQALVGYVGWSGERWRVLHRHVGWTT